MENLKKLLLVSAFLNGLSWILLIPVWQYPDEQAHFAQVQDVGEFGFRPQDSLDTSLEVDLSEKILGTDRDGMGNNRFTYHPEYRLDYSQSYTGPGELSINNLSILERRTLVKKEATFNPPLYYFLGSAIYRVFYESNLFVRVFAVRFLSLTFFLALVFLSIRIGKILFREEGNLSILLAILVAFFPMLIFASTGILPDSLTNLLFSMIIFESLLIIRYGLRWRYLFISVVVVFLGFQTRQQFLVAIFLLLIATIIYFVRTKAYKILLVMFFSAGFFLLGFKYFFGFLHVAEIGLPNLKLLLGRAFIDSFLGTVRHTYAEVLPWYWGVYRWLSLTLPPIYYQIINRLILISIAGLLLKIAVILKTKKINMSEILLLFLVASSFIYFLMFAIGDFYFSQLYGYSFGIQGRYFFPLVIAHMAIIVYGFWQLSTIIFKTKIKLVIFAIALSMIIFNDLTLWHVSSSYYDSSNFNSFILQASQYKPSIFKGNAIVVILVLNLTMQALLIFKLYRLLNKNYT